MEVDVSGNWEPLSDPAEGYRIRFPAPSGAAGFPFLEVGGVVFVAEVWLNGEYLGFHAGSGSPVSFPVVLEAENLLEVRVAGPGRPGPGPVSLVFRPQLYLSGLTVTPYLAPDCRTADLVAQVVVENYADRPITEPLRILVAPHNFAGGGGVRHPLIVTFPPGRSEHTFTVTLKRPELWWSWDLGFPSLYKAMVLVGGEAVPQAETLAGIREFRISEDGSLSLNGQRFHSQIAPEQYAEDVGQLRQAGLNLVRVAGRLEQAEFYRRCDEEGILVWQGLPAHPGDDLQRACAAAQATVLQLHNHPSVVAFYSGGPDNRKLADALVRAVAAVDRTRPFIKG